MQIAIQKRLTALGSKFLFESLNADPFGEIELIMFLKLKTAGSVADYS